MPLKPQIPPALGELVEACGMTQQRCGKCEALLIAFSRPEENHAWSCHDCALPDATQAEKDLRS